MNKTRLVSFWLFFVCLLIALTALVGAITRLTESGLSIMEWAPFKGMAWPSEKEMQRLWLLYQKSGEFKFQNPDMAFGDFSGIVFWEWFHRNLARFIGLAYGLPMILFWVLGWLPNWIKRHLVVGLILGASQAALGWYMVHSGFSELTDVSHFRLMAHLGLALFILAYLYSLGFTLLFSHLGQHSYGNKKESRTRLFALLLLGLAVVTLVSGVFVAGLNAGFIYNEYPFMGGRLVPSDYWGQGPILGNLLSQPVSAQFHHRVLTLIFILAAVSMAYYVGANDHSQITRLSAMVMVTLVVGQFCLGIVALLLVVPVWAGVLHQGGAILVLLSVVSLSLSLGWPRYVRKES